MRVQNKSVTVRGVIFSKTFALIYFVVMVFFLYKAYSLYPIWSGHYAKNLDIKREYADREIAVKELQEKKENEKTDLGKLRYEKEFFNKLDEGEEMIILYYGDKQDVGDKAQDAKEVGGNIAADQGQEKERHMFFWEKWYLDILVWWRNL